MPVQALLREYPVEIAAPDSQEGSINRASDARRGEGGEVDQTRASDARRGEAGEVDQTRASDARRGEAGEVDQTRASDARRGEAGEVDQTRASDARRGEAGEVDQTRASDARRGEAGEVDQTRASDARRGEARRALPDEGGRASPPLIDRPPVWHLWLTSFRVWGPVMHLLCLLAVVTGVTTRALILGVVLYWLRMFAVTGGYHRYFSHRSYKTSRAFQFVLGFLGCMCVERGPLWWASTHRKHHRYSDLPQDVHSPVQRGFWYAHVGWLSALEQMDTDLGSVKDLVRYPELRWLDRNHWVSPLAGLIACYLIAGWSGLVIGGFWSTVALWHGTFAVNSLSHLIGSRRYATTDDSRNHWFIALFTMGEGWHNNHHHCMTSARQGFRWWEVDLTYYILRGLAAVGLIWDLREPPAHRLQESTAAAST